MQTINRPTGVVITGPQGSGKTLHADALRKHYGLSRVLDDGLWRSVQRPKGARLSARLWVFTAYDHE